MCVTFKSSNPNTNWCQHTWKAIWIKTDHICTSLKFSFTGRIISSFRKLPVCTNATITFECALFSWDHKQMTKILPYKCVKCLQLWLRLWRCSLQSCVYPAAERIQCLCFPLYGACFTILDARHREALCEHPAAPVNLLVMAPWGLNSPDPLKELVPSTYSPVTWTGSILGRVGVSPVLLDETQLQTISAPSLRDVCIFHICECTVRFY